MKVLEKSSPHNAQTDVYEYLYDVWVKENNGQAVRL